LAKHDLFAFADTLMDVAPQLLGSIDSIYDALMSDPFDSGCHDIAFDGAIVRRLFEAGTNPNLSLCPEGFSSCWKMLLRHLAKGHQSICTDDVTKQHVYADSCIQDAIKLFIEFGAKLKPEEVKTTEMITDRVPGSNGLNFDWQELLGIYSHPAKQIELEEARRKRLLKWPENSLTAKERRKFIPVPELSEQWWSDRGRRLLGLIWAARMELALVRFQFRFGSIVQKSPYGQ
jgi:hypothetical protein